MKFLDEAKKTLKNEIDTLNYELRVTLPEMIKRAVELGDLRENADYKAALERQEMVRIKLSNLSKRLSDISMIVPEKLSRDRAGLGSELTVLDLDTDEEKTYRLVISEQTIPEKGLISIQSPIGKAFIGKEEGDDVVIRTPQGRKHFEILTLKTIHDFED